MPKQKTLLDRTLDLLELHHGAEPGQLTYQEIADGAGVEREWLAKLARRSIPNPGVVGVEKVHGFLASRRVKAA